MGPEVYDRFPRINLVSLMFSPRRWREGALPERKKNFFPLHPSCHGCAFDSAWHGLHFTRELRHVAAVKQAKITPLSGTFSFLLYFGPMILARKAPEKITADSQRSVSFIYLTL